MLIIELNEFDPNYFKKISKELNLEHIQHIFKLKHATTFTDEQEEYQGLDPGFNGVFTQANHLSNIQYVD